MPSRANTPRIAVEWLLRAVSIVLLGLLLWRVLSPEHRSASALMTADSDDIPTSLPSWSGRTISELHLTLDSVPTPVERDWLAAVARAGTRVTWEGLHVPATAITVAAVIDPVAQWRVAVAAPVGAWILLRDDVGIVDSIRASSAGVRAVMPSMLQRMGATINGTTAWATVHDSATLKRLLVEGQAGWETKFAIAALQERGWTVDALSHVAPGVDVREGAPSRPDTARYAAVIAIDSSARLIAQGATAFVRNGGGLITLRGANGIGPTGSPPIVLERRADGVMTAYRVGRGRVVRVGYKDVWRSRMAKQGATSDTVRDPVAANRDWWASVVASVAYAPRSALQSRAAVDPAPFASLVDRIGLPSTPLPNARRVAATHGYAIPDYLLFGMLITTLLLEWASRRLRGAP